MIFKKSSFLVFPQTILCTVSSGSEPPYEATGTVVSRSQSLRTVFSGLSLRPGPGLLMGRYDREEPERESVF